MGSVFYTENYIHEMYDIKGSLEGRRATEKERQQEIPVLKDLDFLDGNMKIRVNSEKSKIFVEQIEKDSHVKKYLENHFFPKNLSISF